MSGSKKRKTADAYFDDQPDDYFQGIIDAFSEDYGVDIGVKHARRFAADPRIGMEDAAEDVTMLEDEESEGEGEAEEDIEAEDEGDDALADFMDAADALDREPDATPIPDDFVAAAPRPPTEIIQTLIGRSLGLSDDQPERRAAFLAAETKLAAPDAFPPPAQRAFTKMVEASLATSMVFAYVLDGTAADIAPETTRAAPTLYGTAAIDGDANAERQHQQLDQVGDLSNYLDTDQDDPSAKPFVYANKQALRGQGLQGPHTIAHCLSSQAFANRIKEETDACKALLAKAGDAPYLEEQASWQALEGVFVRFTSLPDDLEEEIDANIGQSRMVQDTDNPGMEKAEKVTQAEMDEFQRRILIAVGRLKELYVEIDQAIQTAKASLREAQDASKADRWTEDEFAHWEEVDERMYYAAEALVFEYKNMEPCATYAWNLWRKATKEERAGKGEKKVSDALPGLLSDFAAATQGKKPQEAAVARWQAMLDLGDYASKAVDGSDSGLDGQTLLAHITREISLVDEDSPELLTEIVMLSGLFPSREIHGDTILSRSPAFQKMVDLENSLISGTVRLADLRGLLTEATQAGKFDVKPVLDPLHPREPEPPLTKEQADAKFEERLAMLVEIAKRRRVRLAV